MRNLGVSRIDITDIDLMDLFSLAIPGIYVWSRNSQALYVGQAVNILRRVTGPHHAINVAEKIQHGDVLRVFPEDRYPALYDLESQHIRELKPLYNLRSYENRAAPRYDRRCEFCKQSFLPATVGQAWCSMECKIGIPKSE